MRKLSSALLALLVLLAMGLLAEGDSTQVPAHHTSPPKKGEQLPPILPRDQLWGPAFQNAYQVHAYELAARIPAIIYQQPCYCYCDRIGHTSLHTCYEGTHAAHCSACLKELYYSYQMHKRGKTAAQIRKGIIAGEWENVDLQTADQIN
ncbi:MAG TPA: CYCXC family (seleno)protein [Terriglobales bacterium]|nr:CYCXC family (seleno)protein [Terriglobales bacterium]